MTRKPNVNPHEKAMSALRVIRTWACYQITSGTPFVLNPHDVLKLCDEAIDANRVDREVKP